MRNIGITRIIEIPNPFKYQRMCLELKFSWELIKNIFMNRLIIKTIVSVEFIFVKKINQSAYLR